MVVLHQQKKGLRSRKTKRGKGSKWMVVVDGNGISLGGTITSASPAEVTLIEQVLNHSYGKSKILRLIYDKAADSDPLRLRLAKRGIGLICPHRSNRKKSHCKRAGSFDATPGDGSWNAPYRGLGIAVGCLSDGKISEFV